MVFDTVSDPLHRLLGDGDKGQPIGLVNGVPGGGRREHADNGDNDENQDWLQSVEQDGGSFEKACISGYAVCAAIAMTRGPGRSEAFGRGVLYQS